MAPVKRVLLPFLLLVPSVAACGDRDAAAEVRAAAAERVVPVRTTPARLGSVAREETVSGIVEPLRRVFVNSQMAAEVVAVLAEEGDAVRQGQVLARLDDRQLRAELAGAEAAHEAAEAAYERAEQLRTREIITQAEYERERTAYAAARARLDQLRTRLEFAVIRAPAAGVVTERSVEVGNVVSPQTRLFTVDDVSTLVVRVRVSELDVVHLRRGADVEAALDAYPDRRLTGRIRRIFPSADPATRLVPVEVALEGEGARLARPGFLARVDLRLEARDGVVVVPPSAILPRDGAEVVFVVEDDRARRREVRTGLVGEERVEVLEGLAAGEVVVVDGHRGLSDGAPVRASATSGELETGETRRAGEASGSGGGAEASGTGDGVEARGDTGTAEP